MYKISFNLTDKIIDDYVFQILTSSEEVKQNKEIEKNEENKTNDLKIEKTLSRQEQIEELKKLRTSLSSDNINNSHTKRSKI